MEKPTISQLVEKLTNTCDSTTREQFLSEMKKVHPTLQQKFCGFVLSWIIDYAENYPQDDRNSCSIRECHKIVNTCQAVHDENPRTTFPLI